MMKVLILPKYGPKGASSRYRLYNYIPYFEKENIDYLFKPLLSDKYIDNLYNKRKIKTLLGQFYSVLNRFFFLLFLSKKKYDLIIIEKELFPYFPYFAEAFLLKDRVYSLDYDDYVGAMYTYNKCIKLILGAKIHKLIEKATLTTVGNNWYFSEFKKGNLVYLPTVIDLDKYSIQKKQSSMSIVWIGSPTTVKYLKLIENALVKLSDNINFTLKIIGAKIELDKKISIQYILWNEKNENLELSLSEIGIMPLENNLWEKGKCGFKIIQYMASGLPVIASDLPANVDIINENESGYIARNEDDWIQYIKYLFDNPQISIEMGKKGRERIEKNYSYQVWGPKYVSLIKGVYVKRN